MTRLLRGPFRVQRGFELIELMIVVAVLGILLSIAIPLYANIKASARLKKAEADVRMIATAISAYSAAVNGLPSDYSTMASGLTTPLPANLGGKGPFLPALPAPPTGSNWPPMYIYVPNVPVNGSFVVCATGDQKTVSNVAGRTSCP